MNLQTDAEGLAAWEGAEDDLFGAVARAAAHPGFAAACRALASGMADLAARDRAIDGIFKDAGRYFATMWAFALHEDGGLTLPRLKLVCARAGLLSPGRARALLQFLEYLAYLERRPGPRGATIYAPTTAFILAWDSQFVAALQAARSLAPDIEMLLDPADPAPRQTYGRLHAQGMLDAMKAEPQVSAFLRVFLHPYAGSQILWALVASSVGAEFPPHAAGPVSIAQLARRCGVSRMQVARIFREAEDEGLATLGADGLVQFHAPAREQLAVFYAIQLVQILAAAARAARLHALIASPLMVGA